jgi:hypothetical protein
MLKSCYASLLLMLSLGAVLLWLQEDDSPSSICEQLPLSQLAFKVSMCRRSSSSSTLAACGSRQQEQYVVQGSSSSSSR